MAITLYNASKPGEASTMPANNGTVVALSNEGEPGEVSHKASKWQLPYQMKANNEKERRKS
jgi:hypothetical protein